MIRIGTSGWSYEHWFGRFYPKDIVKKRAFDYYLSRFDTVELNVSFYRLVSYQTFSSWHDKTDKKFLFAVKASRFITHVKRLKNYEESLARFIQNVEALKENIGPILFQLPPNFQKNIATLENFIEGLPKKYRYAFEFRHNSWLDEDIYDVLKENDIALVLNDSPYFPYDEVTTSSLVYIRFHGPTSKYRANYPTSILEGWATKIIRWAKQGHDVHAYFNNDFMGYAPKNALQLKNIINERVMG